MAQPTCLKGVIPCFSAKLYTGMTPAFDRLAVHNIHLTPELHP